MPSDEVTQEAIEWLRACHDWLLENDLDMKMPNGILDTDPLDIADRLQSIEQPKPTWQPIDTAPRDGTLFDVRFGGIRYTDCFFDADGLLVRRHNYPSIRTVFMRAETAEWMPRPPGLIQPYDTDDNGRQYIP